MDQQVSLPELQPPAEPAPAQEARPNRYAERKAELGRCVRCSRRGLPDDQTMCPRCLRKHRKRTRLGVAALRERRRSEGKCAYCELKSETYSCAGCKIARNQVPPQWSKPQSNAPETDLWRKDGEGFKRYRGRAKRGAPGAAANDEQDLSSAADTLERGRAALRYARSPEVQALPRIQRRGAMSEAVALLALASRFLDEVVDRNKPDDKPRP